MKTYELFPYSNITYTLSCFRESPCRSPSSRETIQCGRNHSSHKCTRRSTHTYCLVVQEGWEGVLSKWTYVNIIQCTGTLL